MTAALSAAQRTVLEKLVQSARKWIEADLEEAVEGRYGINTDGRIEPESSLSLTNSEAATRADLVDIVDFLRSEGEGDAGSVARLIREAAFTHTNRLIAVRVAEAIGLLPETMAKGVASSGFRDFSELAPTIATTEWGRFAAFVRLCADELAADVPALFDPRNPLLQLTMSESVLARVVDAIGATEDCIWGAPDTLGWTYQFFNSDSDRRATRYRADGSPKPPASSRELAIRNQFFTPAYVVEFLIHNSLGAYLAPGLSEVAEELSMLVSDPEGGRKIDLGEVSVLDPACGSGHFLLGAYEVLEMAWRRAGVEPSAAAPAIVRSLWGIDIDSRATQIAQAAVMFRARRVCRDERLPMANVICARALPAGPAVDSFINALPDHVSRAVQGIADELVDAPILGPLLKIEERLTREVRDIFGTGVVDGSLSEAVGDDHNHIEAQVLEALAVIADSVSSSASQRLFAAEARDAVRFVEAMNRTYTVVLANPPFGTGCPDAEDYLKAAYPNSWTELYACFVERGLELSTDSIGAITSSTFLTTKRLTEYRRKLVDRGLPAIVDLGAGVLHGATVNTAALVVRNRRTCSYLDLRLVQDKAGALRAAIQADKFSEHELTTFDALPNRPLAFHASKSVLDLWHEGQVLEPSVATVRTGGKTFDNFRYVRAWWELTDDAIDRGWVWYEKGGEYQPYFAPTRLLLNWKNDGAELREYGERSGRLAQVMQSSGSWTLPGLCYPRMSSIGFSARTMPAGEIFADTSIAVIPNVLNDSTGLLGVMNSTLAAEILGIFGRGRSTENNSVKSLPVSREWLDDPELCENVRLISDAFFRLETARETSPVFGGELHAFAPEEIRRAGEAAFECQRRLDRRVAGLVGLEGRVDDKIPERPPLNRSLFESDTEDDLGTRILSFLVGAAFERWQIAPVHANERRDCLSLDPMPWPLAPEATGRGPSLLLDQPGHHADIDSRVVELVDALPAESVFDGAVRKALGRHTVRRYLRSRFFASHVKRYSAGGRKAPIYWPLQVPSKAWGVWVYAPRLSREALFQVVHEAEQRLRLASEQVVHLEREAETGEGGRKASDVARELEGEQKLAVELESFRAEAERIANLGWEPDLDDGLVLNAAPLANLFPAWKEAARYRKELRAGKYEWATVARFADQL